MFHPQRTDGRSLIVKLLSLLLGATWSCGVNGSCYTQAPMFDPTNLSNLYLDTSVSVCGASFTLSAWLFPMVPTLEDPLASLPTWTAVPLSLGTGLTEVQWQPGSNGGSLRLTLGDAMVEAHNVTLNHRSWTHIVVGFEFEKGEAILYANGSSLPLQAPYPKGPFSSPPPNGTLILGNFDTLFNSSNSFPGSIDDVAVWSILLSPDDIASLWNDARPDQLHNQPGAFYSFDDCPIGSLSTAIPDISVSQHPIPSSSFTERSGYISSDLEVVPSPHRPYTSARGLSSNELTLTRRMNTAWNLWSALLLAANGEASAKMDATIAAVVDLRVDQVSTTLNYALINEAHRAQQVEARLGNDLDSEVQRAKVAELDLHRTLVLEAQRAQMVESELKSIILFEIQRAAGTESNITTALQTALVDGLNLVAAALVMQFSGFVNETGANLNALDANITAEVQRASAAEQAATTALVTEIQRASAAEVNLNSALSAETARSTSAEQNLQTALSAESSRAAAAEQSMAALLSTENVRATTSEQNLTKAITAESRRAMIAEQITTTNLIAESVRANIAESNVNKTLYELFGQLNAAIALEKADRVAADLAQSARLDALLQLVQAETASRVAQAATLSARVAFLELRVPHFVFAGVGATYSLRADWPGHVVANQILAFDALLLQQPASGGATAPSVLFDSAHHRIQLTSAGLYRLDAFVRIIDNNGAPVMATVAWVIENSVQALGPTLPTTGSLGDATTASTMIQIQSATNVQIILVRIDNGFGVNSQRFVTAASTINVARVQQ